MISSMISSIPARHQQNFASDVPHLSEGARKQLGDGIVMHRFDRVYRRTLNKLETANTLDHSDCTPQWRKNVRYSELHALVEAAYNVRCISDLVFAELLIDDFMVDGR